MIPLATLQADASLLTGQPTTISCDQTVPAAWAAYVNWTTAGIPIPVIHLRQSICVDLEHVDSAQSIIPGDALAIEHEIEHLALDSQDECRVEAAAVANMWQLVRLLRLAAWRARAILDGVSAADARLPSQYHPDDEGNC